MSSNVLTIKHDLNRLLRFDVQSQHYAVHTSVNKKETRYEFNGPDTITIIKDDPWEPCNKLNVIFMMIYSFDLFIGNAYDCDNLPFSINLCADSTETVFLRDVAVSDSKSIKLWSAAVGIQISMIAVLMLLLSIFAAISIGWIFSAVVITLMCVFIKQSIAQLCEMIQELNKFRKAGENRLSTD